VLLHHSVSVNGRYDLTGLMEKMDSTELKAKLPRPLSPTLVQVAVAADASAVTSDSNNGGTATAKIAIKEVKYGATDIRTK